MIELTILNKCQICQVQLSRVVFVTNQRLLAHRHAVLKRSVRKARCAAQRLVDAASLVAEAAAAAAVSVPMVTARHCPKYIERKMVGAPSAIAELMYVLVQ